MLTLVTFGDSVLDCGWYNAARLTPASLLVHNDDQRFPEFRGRDLQSMVPARLEHRARDGATVADLAAQALELKVDTPALALLSIGGNDLLWSMGTATSPSPDRFAELLDDFLRNLAIRPVLIATIFDPTFGDDRRAFLDLDPRPVRAAHHAFNAVLTAAAKRVGRVIDVHQHFLSGQPDWFVETIEPSLVGASEIRRCFWPEVRRLALQLVSGS
jgi:lysophospholipase L1-like esterase